MICIWSETKLKDEENRDVPKDVRIYISSKTVSQPFSVFIQNGSLNRILYSGGLSILNECVLERCIEARGRAGRKKIFFLRPKELLIPFCSLFLSPRLHSNLHQILMDYAHAFNYEHICT